jgi:hypothetical protein
MRLRAGPNAQDMAVANGRENGFGETTFSFCLHVGELFIKTQPSFVS